MENYSAEIRFRGLLQTLQTKHSRELGIYFPKSYIWTVSKHSKKKIKKTANYKKKKSEKVW